MHISEILDKIEYHSYIGNSDVSIEKIVQLGTEADHTCLSWCSDKYIEMLSEQTCGTYIVGVSQKGSFPEVKDCNYIYVDRPRFTFLEAMDIMYPTELEWEISASANVDSDVIFEGHAAVGHNVVLHKGCRIGDGVRIGDNTVIHKNTIIENDVTIGANCTIGGVGFGYERLETGEYKAIKHIGNVHLKTGVEVGNNTCIDRAVIGSTVIGRNVKVDNLVHIAHGVVVGENSLVIAHSMVAGSVVVGKDVWIAPNSAILNKVSVGDNAMVGFAAVVMKDVESSTMVLGNPARVIKKRSS